MVPPEIRVEAIKQFTAPGHGLAGYWVILPLFWAFDAPLWCAFSPMHRFGAQ
jgi:hypothetical protein